VLVQIFAASMISLCVLRIVKVVCELKRPRATSKPDPCIVTLEHSVSTAARVRYMQSRLPGDDPARVYCVALTLLAYYIETADCGLQIAVIDPNQPDKPPSPLVLELVDGLLPLTEEPESDA